jgi:aminocarboxymuconate-semialdehyde decarboxylase
VIVPEILRNGHTGEDWRPRLRRDRGGRLVEFGGRAIRSMVDEAIDMETLLAARERAGIDGVVVCPWVQLLYPDAEPHAGLERCRIQNEALERVVGAHGGRVAALGVVPLQDPVLGAEELREVRRRGVLAGVEVSASVRGRYLGDPIFEPFWAAADETGAVVFIHPTTRGFCDRVFAEHYLWNTVGNPFETTVVAAQLVMAGVTERHPTLRIMLAHGGGAILALRGRLAHAHGFQPEARADLTESPLDSIRRFYFDTVTHDSPVLVSLIEFAGAERVLLGSDYPFDMADPDPVGRVRSLGLEPAAERAILAGNASRLFAAEPRTAEAAP